MVFGCSFQRHASNHAPQIIHVGMHSRLMMKAKDARSHPCRAPPPPFPPFRPFLATMSNLRGFRSVSSLCVDVPSPRRRR